MTTAGPNLDERCPMKSARRRGSGATGQGSLSWRQWTMIAVPPVLLVTMYVAFQWLTVHYGFTLGYLLAFSLYWGVWCIAVPVALLGTRGVLGLFRSPYPSRRCFSRCSPRRSRRCSGPQPCQPGAATQFTLWWPLAVPLT